MRHVRTNSFKILIFILLMCLIIPILQTTLTSGASINAEIVGFSPRQEVYRGSIIRVKVWIKNTGDQARTFYVGASEIAEGETTWRDLPGWGYTSTINSDSTVTFTFGDYTIPSSAKDGDHGIVVVVWTDSSKSSQVTEGWFEDAFVVKSQISAQVTDLVITVIQP